MYVCYDVRYPQTATLSAYSHLGFDIRYHRPTVRLSALRKKSSAQQISQFSRQHAPCIGPALAFAIIELVKSQD